MTNIHNKYEELYKFDSVQDYVDALDLENYMEDEFNICLHITCQSSLDQARLQVRIWSKYRNEPIN